MRLVVFGGSFDPVHLGHEAMADAAWRELAPDRLLWAPSGRAPHKPGVVPAPAADRAALLRLVLAARPREELCTLELERPAPSYTVDTLRELRARHPDAALHFLLGSDSLAHLAQWREPAALFALAEFDFAPRRGWPREALARFRGALPAELAGAFRARFLDMEEVAWSSTAIRAALARGGEAEGVREEVRREIERRRMYRRKKRREESQP